MRCARRARLARDTSRPGLLHCAPSQAVDKVMGRWEALLARVSPEERGLLQRSMGLKMEQLKAEFNQVGCAGAVSAWCWRWCWCWCCNAFGLV